MNRFAPRLLQWHRVHGRHDLPWQNTRDPYRIWLSEIMLQQTRVDTVVPYYARFLKHFPDVASLAAASLDDVLGLWSGLGYYARARNLHMAAQAIMAHHDGRFPSDLELIANLPGIGRSTAAAVAAFAFGHRVAILDGNVKRVLCRVFGIAGFPGEKPVETKLWALAESLLPEAGQIGVYIQAQMDLGATLCTRTRPACDRCPLATDCVALREDRVGELPTPRPKKTIPRRKCRVALVLVDHHVLLERRPPAGIWGGLLSLPELPDAPGNEGADDGRVLTRFGVEASAGTTLGSVRHAFTHFHLEIQPVRFDLAWPAPRLGDDTLVWQPLDSLAGAGLPAPIRRILDTIAQQDVHAIHAFDAGARLSDPTSPDLRGRSE